MIRCIYIKNKDGAWKFVAAFDVNEIPEMPSDWPQEVTDFLRFNNEPVQSVDFETITEMNKFFTP